LLKKFQLQGRREKEPGAYWVVREEFRRPSTPQMDFFSNLIRPWIGSGSVSGYTSRWDRDASA
jgi:hypothetical protein